MSHALFHQNIAYFFVVLFLVGLGVFGLGLFRKDPVLKQMGVYIFLGSYIVFLVMYFHGLSIEASTLPTLTSEGVFRLYKHHKMSKFMFTGCMIMAVASLVVIFRSRQNKEEPKWFAPNFLYIYITLLFFLARVLIFSFQIRPMHL